MTSYQCTCSAPTDICGHSDSSLGCPKHDLSVTGDDARADLDAARLDAAGLDADWQTVGELLGIGTSWQIQIDLAVGDSPDAYRVINGGMGGSMLVTGVTWTEAVQIAGNQCRSEMLAEGMSTHCVGSELELA